MFYLYKITNIKHKLFVTNRRWFQHTGDIPGNCCCFLSLQWRHNESDGVPNHEPHDCLLNHLFRRRSNKASKLCVTGLCVGNSPVTGEFHAQMASNAENVSIWWRHHVFLFFLITMLLFLLDFITSQQIHGVMIKVIITSKRRCGAVLI